MTRRTDPGQAFLDVLARGDAAEIESAVGRYFTPTTDLDVPTSLPWQTPDHPGWALRLRRLTGPIRVLPRGSVAAPNSALVAETYGLEGGMAFADWLVDGHRLGRWSYRPVPASGHQAALAETLDRLHRASLFSGVVLRCAGMERDAESRGLANLGTREPNSLHTLHNIGSITKLLTAIAVLRVAEHYAIDIDAPIPIRVLASLHGPLPTIRELLTHTSGLPTEAAELDGGLLWSSDPAQNVGTWRHAFPRQAAGGTYRYSNLGYALLGSIIEFTTELSYFDAMESLVFKPLGLERTRFIDGDQAVPGQAVGYAYADDYVPTPTVPSTMSGLGRGAPYGYAHSTVLDLDFLIRQLRPGGILGGRTLSAILGQSVETDTFGRRATTGLFLESRGTWLSLGAGPGSSASARWSTSTRLVALANHSAPAASRISRLGPGQPLRKPSSAR